METLKNEIAAKEKERAKEKQDQIAAELKATQDLYNAQIAQAEAFAARVIENEKAVLEAKLAIRNAEIDNLQAGIGLVKTLAGENKAILAAAVVAENAAGIAKTITNTVAANAKAVGASPLTAGQPWVAINSISAGIGIASSIAATAKALSQLGGGGSAGSAPSLSGGGATATTPAPQMMSGAFQLGGGVKPEPMKAFVVTD